MNSKQDKQFYIYNELKQLTLEAVEFNKMYNKRVISVELNHLTDS